MIVETRQSGDFSLGRALAAQALDVADMPEVASHPDLLELDASVTKDQVERVRALRASALTRPLVAEVRAFVVYHAEGLSETSQNALLKVMEEPPSPARFFLLTERAEALLPTVRSRCAVTRLPEGEDISPEIGFSEEDKPAWMGQAALFLKALNSGAELEVCRVVTGWTRMPREEFARLLEHLFSAVVKAMENPSTGDGAKLGRLAETLRGLIEEQSRNVAVSAACAKILSDI